MKYMICLLSYLLTYSLAAQFKAWQDSMAYAKLTPYFQLPNDSNTYNKIEKLILNDKQIKSFPKTILKLTNLKYLDLSNNKLDTLPNDIKQLKKLELLKCAKCQLKKLPDSIITFKSLKYIILYKNKLNELPSGISQLKQLKVMDLWNNDFVNPPEELYDMSFLKVLDIRNISLNKAKIARLKTSFPNTKVYHDPSCNCPGE